jgi:hypothetical protein
MSVTAASAYDWRGHRELHHTELHLRPSACTVKEYGYDTSHACLGLGGTGWISIDIVALRKALSEDKKDIEVSVTAKIAPASGATSTFTISTANGTQLVPFWAGEASLVAGAKASGEQAATSVKIEAWNPKPVEAAFRQLPGTLRLEYDAKARVIKWQEPARAKAQRAHLRLEVTDLETKRSCFMDYVEEMDSISVEDINKNKLAAIPPKMDVASRKYNAWLYPVAQGGGSAGPGVMITFGGPVAVAPKEKVGGGDPAPRNP